MKTAYHRNQSGFIEIIALAALVIILSGAAFLTYRVNHSVQTSHTTRPLTAKSQTTASVTPVVRPASPTPTPEPNPPSSKPTPAPQPSPTPAPTSTVFTYTNNGQTAYAKLGTTFTVSLDSLYWQTITSSNTQVAKPEGSLVLTPKSGCVPGQGCGTAEQKFQASAAGQSTITSSRTSCGEARTCVGDEGKFSLLVVVQ